MPHLYHSLSRHLKIWRPRGSSPLETTKLNCDFDMIRTTVTTETCWNDSHCLVVCEQTVWSQLSLSSLCIVKGKVSGFFRSSQGQWTHDTSESSFAASFLLSSDIQPEGNSNTLWSSPHTRCPAEENSRWDKTIEKEGWTHCTRGDNCYSNGPEGPQRSRNIP